MLNRREAITVALGATFARPLLAASPPSTSRFAAIEATLAGGRLGVAAIDLATGRSFYYRADERFAHCSTFKVPLVAAVLARIDARQLSGERRIPIAPADLLDYAPATRAALPRGHMTVFELCEAAVVLSDNTAANLLLPLVGGPAGLTRFARVHGDRATRFDRTEPTLNTNLPGDRRDTTTPRAMIGLLEQLLIRPVLASASRARLAGWMVACSTGKARLRAGLPSSWRAGDKTGTGERGAVNDVAIAWPSPHRASGPLLVACYVDAPRVSVDTAAAAHAAVARIAASLVG